MVVRCSSRQEAERWRRALETHTVEDFASQYVQPWPVPTNPTLLRDTLVIDIGSSSIRAGILASQGSSHTRLISTFLLLKIISQFFSLLFMLKTYSYYEVV